MTADRDHSRRLAASSDAELETQLQQLGQSIAWPASGDLAASVRSRLAGERPRRWGLPYAPWWRLPEARVRRAVLLAVAALLLIATVAVALGLGLPGIGIRFGPLPTVTQTSSPAPTPSAATSTASPSALASPSPSGGGLGASLFMGRLVTLDEARTAVDWTVVAPTLSELGSPAEIWLEGSGHTAALSFVWPRGDSRPAVPGSDVGLLITQFRGSVIAERLGKVLGQESRLLPVVVDGERGYWIEGALHALSYPVEGDGPSQDHIRLAGNVLIWTRGDLTLRLEVAGGQQDALRIAESVR